MKLPEFLHIDTNSHKLKFDQNVFGGQGQKMGVASLVTEL